MKLLKLLFILLLMPWNSYPREPKGCLSMAQNRIVEGQKVVQCYLSQDPIGLAGNNPTLYGYVKDSNKWVDPFGLDCKVKMQPYRSDVLTKGPHANIVDSANPKLKITEACLDLVDDKLVWKRFGDMEKASPKSLKEAQKLIDGLSDNKSIMDEAKKQTQQAIDEMQQHLKHGTKKQIDFAERNLPKFEKMLKLF